jgi:hypothetical protein
MLLVAMLVALPPVATLAVFLAAGLLFVELVLWVEAGLLRVLVLAVLAGPWPLPIDAASLGVGSINQSINQSSINLLEPN